ncbi:MAG: SEC-C metal-binding domain-containing protein [Planctomycetota bacterium]
MTNKKPRQGNRKGGRKRGAGQAARRQIQNLASTATERLDPEARAELVSQGREALCQLRDQINSSIQDLLDLIRDQDPVALLSGLFFQECIHDPEEYREITFEGREYYVELVQSLILAKPREQSEQASQADAAEALLRVTNTLDSIFQDVLSYFLLEWTGQHRSEREDRIRFLSVVRYIFSRGADYAEHSSDLTRELLAPHNEMLRQLVGCDAVGLIRAVDEIAEQVNQSLADAASCREKIQQLTALLEGEASARSELSGEPAESVFDKMLQAPEMRELEKEIQELLESTANPLALKSNNELPVQLLERLGAEIGDNSAFIENTYGPGWPTTESILYQRPILKSGGKYYWFGVRALYDGLLGIAESWIRERDPRYFERNYLKKRSRLVELKALQYLADLMPRAKCFHELYYEIEGSEGSCSVRAEVDGLVLFDGNLFVVEAKSGALSPSARRGGLERVRRDVEKLISDPHEQALRVKRYLKCAGSPTFYFEDGSEALAIKDGEPIREVYLVTVTLARLSFLGTDLDSLQGLGLVEGQDWPWSVSLNDLRVVSEILEGPSEFLLFLRRRIAAYARPQFFSVDELDFLMYFIKKGLFFRDRDLGDSDLLIPVAYTEDLDRYYDCVGGRVSSGEKPRFAVPEDYRSLVRELEALGMPGFSDAGACLLSLDSYSQKKLLESLTRSVGLWKRDGKSHEFTMVISECGFGMTFFVRGSPDLSDLSREGAYCKLKMYQLKIDKWFQFVSGGTTGRELLELRVHRKTWEQDPSMEDALRRYKEGKVRGALRERSKVGRNEPCPCNSGQKYKRCCGRLQ